MTLKSWSINETTPSTDHEILQVPAGDQLVVLSVMVANNGLEDADVLLKHTDSGGVVKFPWKVTIPSNNVVVLTNKVVMEEEDKLFINSSLLETSLQISGDLSEDPESPSNVLSGADILTKLKTVDGIGSGLDADTLQGMTPEELAVGGGGSSTPMDAATILTEIKTVDGTGSGLDADLLDGKEATEFALSDHTHDPMAASDILTAIKTVDGTGSGLDADTIQGLTPSEIAGGGVSSEYVPAPFLHIQDQKPQGTYGGAFTAGAWRTRDLNTVLTNTITGASLSNNQITLPAGKYYVEASAPAFAVERHKTRIQEITAGSELLVGSSERNRVALDRTSNVSYVRGMIELSLSGMLELQHYCTTSNTLNGFGFQVGVTTEVYSDIRIWRVGDYVSP